MGWIRKQDPYIYCLQETHLILKHTHRLESKGMEKDFMQIEMKEKARIAILTSDKIDLKDNNEK